MKRIIRSIGNIRLEFFVFVSVVLFSFSPESSIVKRYYDAKEYEKIVDIIASKSSNKLYGPEDYRICGEIAFMYGLYEESSSYYQKVLIVNKKGLTDQDLVNFAFALLKVGKGDQVLTNPCFRIDNKSYPWLNRLKNIAATRNKYMQKKDTMLISSNLSMDFLPQYGIAFYNNRVYFSCSKFSEDRQRGISSENNMIRDRRSELAGIKSALIGNDGKAFSFEELRNKLRGAGRVATINLVDEGDNYFATVVSRDGSPEQIAVQGNLFPGFLYNSNQYACAMPFYNAEDQQLYFCSNRPGGFGGWDIYRCKLNNGKWEEPVNLGAKINTPFDELFPSVIEDKLIFSAEAREGLGGFDNYAYLFKKDSVANLWAFNTSGDDLCLRIIQENPLKAVGVNVPNARFSTSDYDLATILKQGEESDSKITQSLLNSANNQLLADASGVSGMGVRTGVSGNPKSNGSSMLSTPSKSVAKMTSQVSAAGKNTMTSTSKSSAEPVAQNESVALVQQQTMANAVQKEASTASVPAAVPVQQTVSALVPKVNVSTSQSPASVQKPASAPQSIDIASAAAQNVASAQKTAEEEAKDASYNQEKSAEDEHDQSQNDSALQNGALFLVPNPLANKHPEVRGLPLREKRYGEVHLGDLFYDQNSVFFKSAHFPELDSIVEKIRASSYNNIVIWSFTDRCGEEKYNASLSYQRAMGVVEYLKSKLQEENDKLYFTVSARESFSTSSREVNALDRRVEIYAQSDELPFKNIFAYKMAPGENMELVAKIFNNKLNALEELNTKTPELKSSPGFIYVGIQGIHLVSEGESLLRIALNSNCSVDQIIKANHKAGSNALIGERLVLPLPFIEK